MTHITYQRYHFEKTQYVLCCYIFGLFCHRRHHHYTQGWLTFWIFLLTFSQYMKKRITDDSKDICIQLALKKLSPHHTVIQTKTKRYAKQSRRLKTRISVGKKYSLNFQSMRFCINRTRSSEVSPCTHFHHFIILNNFYNIIKYA